MIKIKNRDNKVIHKVDADTLSHTDLSRTDLSRTKGIVSFGPVGEMERIGFVNIYEDEPYIKLGCHYEPLTPTLEAIREKYGEGSGYEAIVTVAVKIIQEQINDK